MYKNISTPRLRKFYSKIFTIESRAFSKGNKELFLKCHYFNKRLYAEIEERGD